MAPIHYATRTVSNYGASSSDATAAAIVSLVEQVLIHDVACTRKVVLDDCILIAIGVGLGMLVLSMVQDVLDKYRSREKEEEMTSVVLFDSDIYELKE